jgi:N-acyl-D-amino-acid deacylase
VNGFRFSVKDVPMSHTFDRVLRNGTIVDGTGRPPFVGDVAITGDRIVAIGTFDGTGHDELDCTGLLVTPGFVDMHTHYDGQVTWDPHLTPSGWHGVTTVVMGNCGVGFAPVRKDDRDWLINVMEGVEDIPGSALHEGIRWDWETFPEYLDALERLPRSLDVATQIPHSAVRGFVMGRNSSEDDPATPAQIAEMKAIVKDAILAGALGFSTSRTSLHKTAAGKLVAGTNALRDELFGIAEALGETRRGVFELANEHVRMGTDIDWMAELATKTGRPVVFNLSQTDFAPGLWREVLAKLESHAAAGAPLYAQVAGRAIGILMGFRATAHPFVLHPSFKALQSLPWVEQLATLRDPAFRARLIAEKPVGVGMFEAYITQTFDKMFPLASGDDYEPAPDRSVAALARQQSRAPLEVAYDAMLERDGEGFLYFPLFNYTNGDLEILRGLHEHPQTKMGLSDGGAHCGAICDGGMPTFMLSHWTRDRSRGGKLVLEHVIKRQTADTAAFYGLHDRGVLAPGYRADVNVIDYANVRCEPPKMAYDLPAGGRRLVQESSGYRMTICAGRPTWVDGQPTGAMPGRLIRGEQPAPELTL